MAMQLSNVFAMMQVQNEQYQNAEKQAAPFQGTPLYQQVLDGSIVSQQSQQNGGSGNLNGTTPSSLSGATTALGGSPGAATGEPSASFLGGTMDVTAQPTLQRSMAGILLDVLSLLTKLWGSVGSAQGPQPGGPIGYAPQNQVTQSLDHSYNTLVGGIDNTPMGESSTVVNGQTVYYNKYVDANGDTVLSTSNMPPGMTGESSAPTPSNLSTETLSQNGTLTVQSAVTTINPEQTGEASAPPQTTTTNYNQTFTPGENGSMTYNATEGYQPPPGFLGQVEFPPPTQLVNIGPSGDLTETAAGGSVNLPQVLFGSGLPGGQFAGLNLNQALSQAGAFSNTGLGVGYQLSPGESTGPSSSPTTTTPESTGLPSSSPASTPSGGMQLSNVFSMMQMQNDQYRESLGLPPPGPVNPAADPSAEADLTLANELKANPTNTLLQHQAEQALGMSSSGISGSPSGIGSMLQMQLSDFGNASLIAQANFVPGTETQTI